MKKVIVTSQNPVKLEAARLGVNKMLGDDFEIIGVKVDSNVSEQPWSSEETLQGAINRVNNAKALYPEADYFIGIEGGIESEDDNLRVIVWIVVLSKSGFLNKCRGADFLLPKQISNLIKEGKDLSQADDIVFKRENSKHSNGTVGILTKDLITRADWYTQTLIFALIPFANEEFYSVK